MAASDPCLDRLRFPGVSAMLMWGLIVSGGTAVVCKSGLAHAAQAEDQLPPSIDMARLSVLHSVPVLQTAAKNIAIHAELDSAGTTPGILGPGVCLTLFMGYPDGSGGKRFDLESTLSTNGQVLQLHSCQGRLKHRGFAADLSNADVFDSEKGFEAFRQRPSLKVRTETTSPVIVGTVTVPRTYNDDSGSQVSLKSTPEGLRLDTSTFDGSGQLIRIEDNFYLWREQSLAPEVYAALGDVKRETSYERRVIHIERDAQGRMQQVWLHRGWNRFDTAGKPMKGTGPEAMLFAQRELLAQVVWSAAGEVPVAISDGRGKQVPVLRSPDGRRLTIGSGDKPVATIERDAKGGWVAVRDASGEHTLFKDALSRQLLAYVPPNDCLHLFQAAGELASARYKTQLRLRCGQAEPRQWESLFTRDQATGLIRGHTSLIDATGSRKVYTSEP